MNCAYEFTFFVDEDLGTAAFPPILREAGLACEILLDHYEAGTPDINWIPPTSRRDWVIITHDREIRYNRPERDAVMQHGDRVIIIRASGTRAEMAQIFLSLHDQIIEFLRRNPAPFIARLYRDRIEMWLSRDGWTP